MRRGPVSAEDSTSPRPSREPGHGPIGKAARRFFFRRAACQNNRFLRHATGDFIPPCGAFQTGVGCSAATGLAALMLALLPLRAALGSLYWNCSSFRWRCKWLR